MEQGMSDNDNSGKAPKGERRVRNSFALLNAFISHPVISGIIVVIIGGFLCIWIFNRWGFNLMDPSSSRHRSRFASSPATAPMEPNLSRQEEADKIDGNLAELKRRSKTNPQGTKFIVTKILNSTDPHFPGLKDPELDDLFAQLDEEINKIKNSSVEALFDYRRNMDALMQE
jgi:hypothetical protein